MAMIGRHWDMSWTEVMGLVQSLAGNKLLVVSAAGLAERPEEWVYARLQHDNPHRYVVRGRKIHAVSEDGHLGAVMWELRPEPLALLVDNGQTGPCEWRLEDDDRIHFQLWSSRATYRLVQQGDELVPVLVYKAGAAWSFESDSHCWNFADRLAERVTRDRRLAAAARAA